MSTKSITITRQRLRALGACNSGYTDVKPFLPAVLSTDKQRNFRLAKKLVETKCSDDLSYPVSTRVQWLAYCLYVPGIVTVGRHAGPKTVAATAALLAKIAKKLTEEKKS